MLRAVLWLKFPVILGGDVAGVVEEVGPSVAGFRVGDPVFALLMPKPHGSGGYAEFAVATESAVAAKPDSLSFEEAAAIPIAGLTALQALRDLGRLSAGQSVLINGASGGVGSFGVQIARAMGASVTAVCGPSNVDFVRGLGADRVIDYSREDFTRRPESYDVVFDAVAKSSFGACARILGPSGVYITTLPSPGVLFWNVVRPLARLVGQRTRAHFIMVKASGADLAYLGRLADERKLKPVIDRMFPLEQAKEAHDVAETERTRGKIVLRVVRERG
jgi:NADPH:quinone reductase-like Zn-dependent oxidoreductase